MGRLSTGLFWKIRNFLQELDLLEDIKDTFNRLHDRCLKKYLDADDFLQRCQRLIKEAPEEIKADVENELKILILKMQVNRTHE